MNKMKTGLFSMMSRFFYRKYALLTFEGFMPKPMWHKITYANH